MTDEEKKAIEILGEFKKNGFHLLNLKYESRVSTTKHIENSIETILNLIEKQSKEIEELKETLKCTQNSWYEDTQKIEEMKKQIDLDNECEIALNSKVMDLEKEIEELKKYKEGYKLLSYSLDNYTSKDKIKAKIEELDEEIKVKKEIARKPMDRVSGRLLTDNIVELEKAKKVLESLLENE